MALAKNDHPDEQTEDDLLHKVWLDQNGFCMDFKMNAADLASSVAAEYRKMVFHAKEESGSSAKKIVEFLLASQVCDVNKEARDGIIYAPRYGPSLNWVGNASENVIRIKFGHGAKPN